MKPDHVALMLSHLATGMEAPKQKEICEQMEISQPDFYRCFYKALKEAMHSTNWQHGQPVENIKGELVRFATRYSLSNRIDESTTTK